MNLVKKFLSPKKNNLKSKHGKKYLLYFLLLFLSLNLSVLICKDSSKSTSKTNSVSLESNLDDDTTEPDKQQCPTGDEETTTLPPVKLFSCTGSEANHYCLKNKKITVYQLFVRLFSASSSTKSGVGTFAKITNTVLDEIKSYGFNTIWLMGILDQANPTVDDVDIIKGSAGSPYAIRDYYALSPDFGSMSDFQDLVNRIHAKGMAVFIDFVPNHVARTYKVSLSEKKSMEFGTDDYTKENCKHNNYFYLDTAFQVPANDESSYLASGGDDKFDENPAKVTGNNQTSPAPDINDWYETVKLNYAYNFQTKEKHFPPYENGIPSTWKKMEDIVRYWIAKGVDGFRSDMSHMVPFEFWQYIINKARSDFSGTVFIAEAYENDPAKVDAYTHGKLFEAGFNHVYDDSIYDWIVELNSKLDAATGAWWASGFDAALENMSHSSYYLDNSYSFIRYTENHDEVRSASNSFNHSGGDNLKLARGETALLFALPGAFLFYNGQEVGENAVGAEGFGGDDDRTTIFDYWKMPEMAKYYNNGTMDGASLALSQKALISYYKKLISFNIVDAFKAVHSTASKSYYPIYAPANDDNHFFTAFARVSGSSRYIIAANIDPDTDRGVTFTLSPEVLTALNIANDGTTYTFTDELNLTDEDDNSPLAPITISADGSSLHSTGLTITSPTFKAHTTLFLKLTE